MNANTSLTKNRKFDEDKAFPHILMSPTIIVMLLLTVYPLLFTIYYSFTDYNLLKSRTKGVNFIAFDNYTKLLQNPIFRSAIVTTVKFTICAVLVNGKGVILCTIIAFEFERDNRKSIEEDDEIDTFFLGRPHFFHDGEDILFGFLDEVGVERRCRRSVHHIEVHVRDVDTMFEDIDK